MDRGVSGAVVAGRVLAGAAAIVFAVTSASAQAAPIKNQGTWYGSNGLDGTLRGRGAAGNPINLLNATGDAPNPDLVYVYDTALNITWLADWNYRANDGGTGLMTWDGARAWADSLTLGGFTDWRLPYADPACGASDCLGSEMSHVFLIALENERLKPLIPTNTGPFSRMQAEAGTPDGNSVKWTYWTGTSLGGGPVNRAFYFDTVYGSQAHGSTESFYLAFAVAVRTDDVFRNMSVGAVPEPHGLALLGLGFGALAVARRRR